jgi:hypothetical protein
VDVRMPNSQHLPLINTLNANDVWIFACEFGLA